MRQKFYIRCCDCKVEVERTGNAQKRCPSCAQSFIRSPEVKEVKKERDRERRRKYDKKRYERPEIRAYQIAKTKARYLTLGAEYRTVRRHFDFIFNATDSKHKTYKGMPFFDDWNPKKGGSIQAGADWVIANLGKRPEGNRVSLNVVHHEIGFVPGNLCWSDPKEQSSNQMHIVLGRLKHENREILIELEWHEERNQPVDVGVIDHSDFVPADPSRLFGAA